MTRAHLKKIIFALAILCSVFSGLDVSAQNRTPSGTTISNFAEGHYKDDLGADFYTISETVTLTVKAVSSVLVTPDESAASAIVVANETIVRQFSICNTSNLSDSYTITRLDVSAPSQVTALYFDVDDSGTISSGDIPVSLNSTQSPVVAPGSCIKVLAQIDTRNIGVDSQLRIDLRARSTNNSAVNGLVEDTGTIINSSGEPPVFTSENDPTLAPVKLVENQGQFVSTKGQTLNYSITFKNSGDVDARNAVLTDNLPNGLVYVPGTLVVDGRALTDQADGDEGSVIANRIEIRFANPIAPGQIVRITFQAMVSANYSAGTSIINVAQIGAQNALTVDTSQAITVVDPFGVVYAARGGASSPIGDARVAIYSDQALTNLLSIPANQGFDPNLANTNAYLTGPNGRYAFALSPNQLGTQTQPAVYYVQITANGYRPRTIQISLSPNGNGLFRMVVRALDGMPVAVAGGFELVQADVDIASIADIAFNIPMFENSTLNISKSVDRVQAEIGDTLAYRVEVSNSSVAPIFDVKVNDTLPDSFSYVKGTARIERANASQEVEPVITGNVLQFDLGTIASGERVNIIYRVRVGVNARNGDSYNAAQAGGRFGDGELVSTAQTRVPVRISGGMFSMRQVIIGRVFVDANGNHMFDKGEKPVVGARLYLANGDAVITDSEGLYNIPAVSEGAQVISLDPITIPQGYLLSDGGSRAGKDWSRLLRTPLGGGGLLRQNFALVASKDESPISVTQDKDDNSIIDAKGKPLSGKEIAKSIYSAGDGCTELGTECEILGNPESFRPVKPGEVTFQSLSDDQLIMTPGANVEVTVAQKWNVALTLNGEKVSNKNIGTTREDRKNLINTYTFVGLGLKPGPNTLTAKAIGPNGEEGTTASVTVYGRGPARVLEMVAERSELQSSGRDSTKVYLRALDQWNNPAQDGAVLIETTAGRFIEDAEYAQTRNEAKLEKVVLGKGSEPVGGAADEQVEQGKQQSIVELKQGYGLIKLISSNQVTVANLKAVLGQAEAQTEVRFIPEMRKQILTSIAEITVGKAAPEMQNRGTDEMVRSHVQFFYRGELFRTNSLITVAYDSQQPLNRLAGRDRLFQLNPLERAYPIFGDSSARFQETESNSKLYARIDHKRSYAMFGDFQADLENNRLTGYSRKLTGVKFHLENSGGDFVTLTGARPDTAFARQIIPGGTFSIVQLFYTDILPGSEVLTLETRDRRNPEIILNREVLTRSLDYNIDSSTGTIFFLRPIQTFDRDLNLNQIVATYEYRSIGAESSVYTARANKNFQKLGLRLSLSYVDQRQAQSSPFRLGGLDASLNLPNKGKLYAEWGMSNGVVNTGFSFIGNSPNSNGKHNGNAFFVSVQQPINKWQSVLRFDASTASRNYYNPFGSTVTPGNTRGTLQFETKPLKNSTLKVNLTAEKNATENVDNNRVAAGLEWTQTLNEKIRFSFGYDFRRFADNKSDKVISSNLVTLGAEYKPTEKLDFSIRREQNLGEADPSYPNQTIFAANYRVRDWAKIFLTQRFASAPIVPISDTHGTGFASSGARRETAIGVESQLNKYTSVNGRYQLENGINGTDSFAVAGLMNRLPVTKTVSIDLGFERAFHLAGNGKSYNNFQIGASWLPNDKFRSSARYEIRNREGFGQILSLGGAGEIRPGWTALARYQFGDLSFNENTFRNKLRDAQVAFAIRPHDTDKYGLLFSYTHRGTSTKSRAGEIPTIFRADVISADGFHQTTKRLELYGRFALKFSADGNQSLPLAGNFTYLLQGRAQYRLSRWFDLAGEERFMYQPSSGSKKQWFGAELGFWATPDIRIGGGYNFSRASEVYGFSNNNLYNKNGFYFVVSSKISKLFNLFGTSKKGLEYYEEKLRQNRQQGNPPIATNPPKKEN